jgi:hypothetical protein
MTPPRAPTRRDPERTERIRVAVRYLITQQRLEKGSQAELARHFQVSRQRVHQIVIEERRRAATPDRSGRAPGT